MWNVQQNGASEGSNKSFLCSRTGYPRLTSPCMFVLSTTLSCTRGRWGSGSWWWAGAPLSLETETRLHRCRSFSATKHAHPTFLQWVCAERQINRTPFTAPLHGVKQGNGSDAAQRCVARPEVGVSKSQIISFLRQWDSVAFHSALISWAPNEEGKLGGSNALVLLLFFVCVMNPKMLQLFKVKIAENSLSFVLPSFGVLDFSILDKNNPHELLISNISEEKKQRPFWKQLAPYFLELFAKKMQKSAKWWRTTEEFTATGVWEVLSWPVYCDNLQNTSLLLQWWDFFEGIWEQICQKWLCYLVMFIFIIPAVMTTTVLQSNLITALWNQSHWF